VLACEATFALGKYAARAAVSLSLGLALFVALGFIYMVAGESAHAKGLSAILGATVATIWNPISYLALIGCVLAGIAIAGRRPTTVPRA